MWMFHVLIPGYLAGSPIMLAVDIHVFSSRLLKAPRRYLHACTTLIH